MNDRLGQQLGNYRLMRILGQGGFADVYLGEHVYLKTQAALKVLQMRVAGEDMEGFLNEARTIANLKHPHIVRVLDFGVERDIPYLVMEYAPFGTLRQIYPRGTRLPLTAVVSYVKQVASALQYAHERRLVHRDVKPENILLESDNDILLSDFGIALVAQSSRYQNTQETAGTIAYMAPEQLQGKPRPASDQYALGIVVYEWISGDRPFHGSFTEMYSQHLFVPPPPISRKVPMLLHDVDAVIQTALAKDPQQRFPSVQTFAEALEQAAQKALPTVIVPPRGMPPLAKPSPESGLPQGTPDAMVEAMLAGQTPEAHLPQRTLSRRTILLGAVGLAVAGGVVAWLTLARNSSSGTNSNGSAHASPSVEHTSTPGRTATASQPVGYLFFTYQGHSASVGTVAWAPNGQHIASGSSDRTAKIWDASSGTTLVTFRGHAGAVQSVAWSPGGTHIASGSRDKTVQIWDAISGNTTLTYRNHLHQVNTALWSSDGVRIASSSTDDTVHLWDAASGVTQFIYRRHPDYVWSAGWSPDGQRIASACNDGTVQVWQAA